MDVRRFIVESATFTRATLWEKPSRWLIFILLGLPWMALSSLAESWMFLDGTTIHWNLIPWQEAGLLIGAGVLCNLLVSGWIVRLLRDDPVPPDFDHPLMLCLDGMKFYSIPLVWMLVPSVLAFAQYSVAGGSTVSINLWQPDPATIIILVLLILQIIILFIAVQYVTIGTIRFARTGSVREGLAVLEVKKTIGRIGIVHYYIALGVIAIVWMLFSLCLRGIALVPFAGQAISLCLSPVPTVYCFRFMAHFCDEERLSGGVAEGETRIVRAPAPESIRALVPEFLLWTLILAVLVFLCFTPMVLVFGAVSRFLP
ncbi:MAG: DUF4013 domain-containing protein [Methanoregula sp.]|jgi:hypothetical protein